MFTLNDSVGNNLSNEKEDVLAVKYALSGEGLFDTEKEPEPHGYIMRDLDEGIKTFQKQNDLRVDGRLYPNGETEHALNVSAAAKKQEEKEQERQRKEKEKKERKREFDCSVIRERFIQVRDDLKKLGIEMAQINSQIKQKEKRIESLDKELREDALSSVSTTLPGKKAPWDIVADTVETGMKAQKSAGFYEKYQEKERLNKEIPEMREKVNQMFDKGMKMQEELTRVAKLGDDRGCPVY